MAVLLSVLALGGCAIGVTHRYDNVVPEIRTAAGSAISLGAQDRRPYVLSGDKTESFAGLSRAVFGNPFDVTTASGRPLAEDFARAIQQALTAKSSAVTTVRLAPELTDSAVIKRLTSAGQKAILVIIKEWRAVTYFSTRLLYDVSVKVVDASGTLLGESRVAGSDNLGSNVGNPTDHARAVVPMVFRRKLEQLFSAPGVTDNL